ncbi:MAG: hypothetical protein RLZZ417_3210 [Bacteroidota bacterium]
MYELNAEYLSKLEELAVGIQDSPSLASYLNSEEEDDYIELKNTFEPSIAEIYQEVATNSPLQLIALEQVLMDPVFEGLFLPKLLGYVVLRGNVNKDFKYIRPQDHFKDLIIAISTSPNFELLRKRIGMSVQVGFALCSDIWITNVLESIDNKRVKQFFQNQKNEKFVHLAERKLAYSRFLKQFQNDTFLSAEFPSNTGELVVFFPQLKRFLLSRVNKSLPNESLIKPLSEFVINEEFWGTMEHQEIMLIFGLFFETPEIDRINLHKTLNKIRTKESELFSQRTFTTLLHLHQDGAGILTPDADLRLSSIIDKTLKDDLASYYLLIDKVHKAGYTNESVQEEIRQFHAKFDGLSDINECLRLTISQYFLKLIKNLEEQDYMEFFGIFTQLFPTYQQIFNNQHFNMRIREAALAFVDRLQDTFLDKRGRDYQEVKKFVGRTFVEIEFVTEKEFVERFKTVRKAKEA